MLLGAWQSSVGLIVIGVLWFGIAFACLQQSKIVRSAIETAKQAEAAGGSGRPEISTATFLRGTALFLVAGVPAMVVGLTEWQIEDSEYRLLPLIVGSIIVALAVVAAAMYLLGSRISAAIGDPPTVPAQIVVVSSKETGTYINNMPRLEFELDVTPEGAVTYRVTKRATVPHSALGGIQPGNGFKALVVGQQDPTNMDIDWSAPTATSPTVAPATDRLRELDDLKSQGLITDDEHAAQRQRILDSL